MPLHLGFLFAGLLALAIVAVVERGRLFRPTLTEPHGAPRAVRPHPDASMRIATMGGHQVTGIGSGDDGYDEDGYDESQRAEILEATRDGPSDGDVLTDLDPDLGGESTTDEDDLTDLRDGRRRGRRGNAGCADARRGR